MFYTTPEKLLLLRTLYVTITTVSHVEESKKDIVKYIHRLAHLGFILEDTPNGCFMIHHKSESSLVVEVKSKQCLDQSLMVFKEAVL